MDVRIIVSTGVREQRIDKLPDGRLRVFVRAKAENGKANESALIALAGHFRVSPDDVRIVSGKTTPRKVVRVREHAPKSRSRNKIVI